MIFTRLDRRIYGFRASGLPGFRASGLPGFRASGLPGFRASGLPGFRILSLALRLSSDFKRTTKYVQIMLSVRHPRCIRFANRIDVNPSCSPLFRGVTA